MQFDEELGRLRVPIVADLAGFREGQSRAVRETQSLFSELRAISGSAARGMFSGIAREARRIGDARTPALAQMSGIMTSLRGMAARSARGMFDGLIGVARSRGRDFLTGIFQGMGQSLYGTLVNVAMTPFRAFWSTIEASTDAKAVQRKFKSVFAEMSDDAEAWAVEFSSKIGRSVMDIKGTLSRFQDTLVPIGFERGFATKTSQTLTRLAGDLAASEQISQFEAADRIVSGMVGNHEALRRFGVIITESTLGAKLMEMGIKGGTKAATEQQKAIARLNILLAGTRDAQGTAARAAGDFSMELQKFYGVMRAAAASIGDLFTPALSVITRELSGMVGEIDATMSGTDNLGQVLAENVSEVIDKIKPMRDDVMSFFEGIIETGKETFGQLSELVGDAESFTEFWDKAKPALIEGAHDVADNVSEIFASKLGEAVKEALLNAMIGVTPAGFASNTISGAASAASENKDAAAGLLVSAIDGVKSSMSSTMDSLIPDWAKGGSKPEAPAEETDKPYNPGAAIGGFVTDMFKDIKTEDLVGKSPDEIDEMRRKAMTGRGFDLFQQELDDTGLTPILDGIRGKAGEVFDMFDGLYSDVLGKRVTSASADLDAAQREYEKLRSGIDSADPFGDAAPASPQELRAQADQLKEAKRRVDQAQRDYDEAQRVLARSKGKTGNGFDELENPDTSSVFGDMLKDAGDAIRGGVEALQDARESAEDWSDDALKAGKKWIEDGQKIKEDKEDEGGFDFMAAEQISKSIQQALGESDESELEKERNKILGDALKTAGDQLDEMRDLPAKLGSAIADVVTGGYGA